mmetsp:Transcript_13264/g.32217  ORF Transcript_13264/g.32217 Transcript_13264/m.32217 type:complete len:393 (-) Transcript_13264:614-1792(-)
MCSARLSCFTLRRLSILTITHSDFRTWVMLERHMLKAREIPRLRSLRIALPAVRATRRMWYTFVDHELNELERALFIQRSMTPVLMLRSAEAVEQWSCQALMLRATGRFCSRASTCPTTMRLCWVLRCIESQALNPAMSPLCAQCSPSFLTTACTCWECATPSLKPFQPARRLWCIQRLSKFPHTLCWRCDSSTTVTNPWNAMVRERWSIRRTTWRPRCCIACSPSLWSRQVMKPKARSRFAIRPSTRRILSRASRVSLTFVDQRVKVFDTAMFIMRAITLLAVPRTLLEWATVSFQVAIAFEIVALSHLPSDWRTFRCSSLRSLTSVRQRSREVARSALSHRSRTRDPTTLLFFSSLAFADHCSNAPHRVWLVHLPTTRAAASLSRFCVAT